MADDPVVCVMAGAGAGKTRVLTLRVARRIEDGSAHPMHVLVCTFSRKAADELRSRLWALGAGSAVPAGTFHRTALRLLGRYQADRGEPPPVVADRRTVLASMLQGEVEAGVKGRPRRPVHGAARNGVTGVGRGAGRGDVARLDAEIGWAKARLVSPADYEAATRAVGRRPGMAPARVADLYERYEAARRRRGVMDLDDLLVHCGHLLETDASFARAVRWWHRHVFVDEAQDMNEAQYRLLCHLVGEEADLFAVGDPNQSVYGWNGADPGLLRRISEEFAGTRVVRLDANHRCTPQVVTAAAAVLDLAGSERPVSTRPDGPLPQLACLPTDASEAAWVARHAWLAHRPGRHWSSIAVLARTNAQLARFAAALEVERVPYRLAGGELGPGSDVSGSDHSPTALGADGRGRAVPGVVAGAPAGATAGMDDTGTDDTRMDDARMDDARMDDADAVDARARRRAFDETPDGQPSGEGWREAQDEDRVVLSTFHRSKGLQWPVVFVVGLVDGTVPLVTARTKAARAEERRLLYVALTRAEDELVCTWALHADELAASRDEEPRSASPWLESVRQAVEELRRSQSASEPERVTEHLERIRQLLPTAAGRAEER